MEITKEKEIAERIINLINKLHPVKTPRVDLDMPSFKRSSTDIIINLVEKDNVPYTFINVLDGTESCKSSAENGELITNNFLNISTLKILIDYLLANFPVVYSFNVNSNSISFTLSFSKNNDFYITPGISLESISIEIRITDLKLEKQLKEYLIFIISSYQNEFISHLNEDEIRKLLVNISNERFIEIINNFISKETKLERLMP